MKELSYIQVFLKVKELDERSLMERKKEKKRDGLWKALRNYKIYKTGAYEAREIGWETRSNGIQLKIA